MTGVQTCALPISLIVILAIIHSSSRKNSGGLQVAFTLIKIGIIVLFCLSAILLTNNTQPISFTPSHEDIDLIIDGSFAISLIYVSYAYTGWNAATYLSSELENPQKTLPWVLIFGTIIVTVLYVSLNYVFLKVTPIEDMQQQVWVPIKVKIGRAHV